MSVRERMSKHVDIGVRVLCGVAKVVVSWDMESLETLCRLFASALNYTTAGSKSS